ncbi:MAG: beta-ketoacyl synthase, partial [Aestuariibacter sp.]|nr:beta-ketoacyl synthase [Aestuariibacter sp.]
QQIASPVQWVKGLETLYENGVRTFLEVGPKRALRGFVNDVFANRDEVQGLMTNHPKTGALPTFNQALCGLYAAGFGGQETVNPSAGSGQASQQSTVNSQQSVVVEKEEVMAPQQNGAAPINTDALSQLLAQALQQTNIQNQPGAERPYDRDRPPLGSVVISGTGLGLPGSEKSVMDPNNALRILNGEQFVDLIPERFRHSIVNKRITRLVKTADGSGSFKVIDDPDLVIKLAGRPGYFDLEEEYGVPAKLIDALDTTTQLAMAAGLDALREAGIPLTMAYKRTTTGKFLPQKWMLPEALRDETGVIFASAFPGGDRFAEDFKKFYVHQNRLEQLETLEDLRRYTKDNDTLLELDRRILDMRGQLERNPYIFDRKFLFRILSMGHSQFAEYIGARGPNTQVNAACASTTQAIGIAEDWIRNGRCRRVIVIAADNVTDENLMEWVGSGMLALGAAATDDRVNEAALPFDKRRHGTILGMGACALVMESEDTMRERGMRGIVEMLSSEIRNSAFHGSRLDVDHIAMVMDSAITTAERRFGINRQTVAPQMVFMSHETYTPARGGSASAEVTALRKTFGEAAKEIIVANTKGFTGHPMGVGIEDVIALKILEHGIVPPVPNYKEVDPDLGQLNLSRGGRYPVQYSLHLSAGFGSQIAFSFTRRIPGGPNRTENPSLYQQWLDAVSGHDHAELEVEKRVLRIVANGAPIRPPAPSRWQYGTGPTVRTLVSSGGAIAATPAPMVMPELTPAPEPVQVAPPKPAPKPDPVPVEREKTAVNGQQTVVSKQSAQPVVAPPAPKPEPAAPAVDEIAAKVLAIVADQTGYPTDMLDMDLDLEADLGIDTVKQAETFAAIRSEFDIPRRDDVNLREYSTLEKVIGFVKEMRPDLVVSEQSAVVSGQSPVIGEPEMVTPSSATDDIAAKVLAIVADQTGYPTDMLDMDLDLEADLGIDTVKQAETFAAIRTEFDIPRRDDVNLREYSTLEKVIGFVIEMRPDLVTSEQLAVVSEPAVVNPEPAAITPAPAHPSDQGLHTPSSATDEIAEKVLAIVADQTGYPPDMLELDLDLEADLGVDTVKQAETFA